MNSLAQNLVINFTLRRSVPIIEVPDEDSVPIRQHRTNLAISRSRRHALHFCFFRHELHSNSQAVLPGRMCGEFHCHESGAVSVPARTKKPQSRKSPSLSPRQALRSPSFERVGANEHALALHTPLPSTIGHFPQTKARCSSTLFEVLAAVAFPLGSSAMLQHTNWQTRSRPSWLAVREDCSVIVA